jgi:hypothetical protein
MALHAAQAKEKSGLFFRARRAVADLIGKTPALRSILAPLQKLTGLDPMERHRQEGAALVRRHEREKRQMERKERFLARIEQREVMAMERKLARLEREELDMAMQQQVHPVQMTMQGERPSRPERRNLRVAFNDAREFAEGIDQAQAEDEGEGDERARSWKARSERIRQSRQSRRSKGYRREKD